MDEFAADPEETDSDEEDARGFDEEEGGGFNEEGGVFGQDSEAVTQDSDLERRGEDVDGVVHMEEREMVGEAWEMPGIRDDLGLVRNSEDSGLEHVPITRQEEPSIIDSVSTNV